jgi:Phage integrase family
MFQSVAERVGLPADRRHLHCLKHALGFSLVTADVNLACVKVALGHKSIASTAIYAVPTDEQVGKAVNAALASVLTLALSPPRPGSVRGFLWDLGDASIWQYRCVFWKNEPVSPYEPTAEKGQTHRGVASWWLGVDRALQLAVGVA